MSDVAEAYKGVRERVTALVQGCDPQAMVPGCPAWSVNDVLAHLAGVIDDILAGRLEGVASDAWTAAQVEARRGWNVAAMIDEWTEKAPQVEAMAESFGAAGRQLVFDAVTHEHDIRGALDEPGATDSDAVLIGADFVTSSFVGVLAVGDFPTLAVTTPSGSRWVSGDGEPAARVRATEFELLRSFSGRRTVEQVRSLDWDGDPKPYLGALTFGPFRPAEAPLAV